MSSRSRHKGQWLFGSLFLALPCALLVLYLWHGLPAATYTDAMATGQYQRAARLLQPEILRNNPQAHNSLANLHYLGLGVERDYRRAALLYHAAAARGFAAAQLNLGHLYRQGLGVDKDIERSYAWYVHADIAGSPLAEYYLSRLSAELTLTPLQMQSIRERWQTLEQLSAEAL
ncbi:tetratricopeptide repeat protein [Granulosicoccus sp. 3-233]|uniref:tetratricopeptide repeat protein n=1 Tax=Granulosicoccus sp. 3-233 TaxID=3417969 RepID=UPI003D35908B